MSKKKKGTSTKKPDPNAKKIGNPAQTPLDKLEIQSDQEETSFYKNSPLTF